MNRYNINKLLNWVWVIGLLALIYGCVSHFHGNVKINKQIIIERDSCPNTLENNIQGEE